MAKTTCPICGDSGVVAKRPAKYQYTESGLSAVVLRGGVTLFDCNACGERTVRIEKQLQLMQALAAMLLASPGRLSGPELKYIRKQAELTQAELATALGLRRRETIAERERATKPRMTEAEEFVHRAILLVAFRKALRDFDHLAPPHIKLLDRLEASLTGFVERALPSARGVAGRSKARPARRWDRVIERKTSGWRQLVTT